MLTTARLTLAAAFLCALASMSAAALADPATPPSPAPAALADPCGPILSIVNRPTFGTGVCTVRTGHFDIENGYTNVVTTGAGGGNAVQYPQSLVRIGTFDPHFDLEFGVPNEARSTAGGATVTGSTDFSLGAKYELGYSTNAVWGVNGIVTIPSGTAAFTAGNPQFSAGFNAAYTINSEFGVAVSLPVNAFSSYNAAGAAQSYFAFVPAIELTAALPGGPSQIGAEYAYFTAAGPNLGGKSWFDFVYQRDFGPHLQFDVEYGFSPTLINGQKQHYAGAGLSFMN